MHTNCDGLASSALFSSSVNVNNVAEASEFSQCWDCECNATSIPLKSA